MKSSLSLSLLNSRKSKIVLKLALIFFGVGFLLFGMNARAAESTPAKNYWKTYFTKIEADAVKKNAEKYVLSEIKKKSDSWKGVFSSFHLKKGSINDRAVKDGGLGTDKIRNLDSILQEKLSSSGGTLSGVFNWAAGQTFSADNLAGTYAALNGSKITGMQTSQISGLDSSLAGKLSTTGGTLTGAVNWAAGQTFSADNLIGSYAALNGSQITGLTASQVGAIPYSGATSAVDLGSKTITTTGTGNFGNIKTSIVFPSADSTSAFQIDKADGTTNILNVDTTNGRVGIGSTLPQNALDVMGDVSFSGLINGATISIYSTDPINAPNLFMGVGAGNNTMSLGSAYNTGIGYWSMNAVTSGNHNVGVGANTLKVNTAGNENTTIGVNGLRDNTTGSFNTTLGTHALRHNTTADANTAIGDSALITNTTGYSNTAVGMNSLQALQSGFYNTAVGGASLYNLAGGAYRNTAIGYNSGLSITSGSYNTFIGFGADGTSANWQSVAIGYNAKSTKDYQVVLGGTSITETLLRGNIGIGTTSPAATLDVNGEVKLKKDSSQPYACDATHDGTIALTSGYRTCVCKGGSTTWVFTSDGTTTCTW